MPDVWATVTELDPAMQERLAGVLEAGLPGHDDPCPRKRKGNV